MLRDKKALFTLMLLLSNFVGAYGAKYKCEISNFGTRCDIKELNLTRENFEIEPETDNPSAIEDIRLHGIVPILSARRICQELPNLKKITAKGVSLKKIQENAFQGCENILDLYLQNNNFRKLERNSFKGLSNVQNLRVYGGKIPAIDLDLTDSQQLSSLGFSNLSISVFFPKILSGQTNLKLLFLCSNNFFDLDVEGIVKYAPNLKVIYLNDNNFKCSRVAKVLKLLKTKNITASTNTGDRRLKTRDYTPKKVDGIHCLGEEQWNLEFAKLSPELQSLVKSVTKTIEQPRTAVTESHTNPPEKLTKTLTTLRDHAKDLQKSQDEKLSDLETKLRQLYEENKVLMKSQNEKIVNVEKKLDKVLETLTGKNESQRQTLTRNIADFQANQSEENYKLKESLNTRLDALQRKESESILKWEECHRSMQALIVAQGKEILYQKKSLETLTTQSEVALNRLLRLGSEMDKLDRLFQQMFEKINTDFEKFQNETRTELNLIKMANKLSVQN